MHKSLQVWFQKPITKLKIASTTSPTKVYELIDPPAPAGALDSMIRRPEDEVAEVEKEIEKYFANVLPSLEDYIISHDRQKVIELNGLLQRKELLNTLMNKLATYCAYCAIQPIPLFPEDEENDPDLEADDLVKMLVKRVKQRFLQIYTLASAVSHQAVVLKY